MRRRHSGRIVNIVSIGGKVSVPHLVPYSASKFALYGLSAGLRVELASSGILVTTVCPGLMRTGSPVNALFKGKHRAEHAWFSISDSLPLLTVNAERAARAIVRACIDGRAELIVSAPARVLAALYGLAPGVTQEALSLVGRLLPGPGGIGENAAPGSESESSLSPSILTRLGDRAARDYNEVH
jgi:short-subunit dehydrogenase